MGSRVPSSRFEYRVFAPDLGALRARLAASGMEREGDAEEAREEVYLLGPREDRNVKIRAGAVDVKALRERRGALERWEPSLRAPLPVPGPWVREALAESLGLERLDAPRACYDRETLLDEIRAREPAVRAVRVHKTRERFSTGGLLAEFTRIRGEDGLRLHSVALESEDPEVLGSWVRRLGLDRWPNESYVRRLRRPAGDRGPRSAAASGEA